MLRLSEFIPWGPTRGPPFPAHRRKGDLPSDSGAGRSADRFISLFEWRELL